MHFIETCTPCCVYGGTAITVASILNDCRLKLMPNECPAFNERQLLAQFINFPLN